MPENTKVKRTRFHQWLIDYGVNQSELARRSGFSSGYIGQLASGLWPRSESAGKIVDALHEMGYTEITVEHLFDDIKE